MAKKLIRLTEGTLHRIVKESVNRVLNEMNEAETIKIAPDLEEIEISDTEISTAWNGGIRYVGKISRVRQKFGDDTARAAFQAAIGMSSKPWQMEEMLNNYFKINGKVTR